MNQGTTKRQFLFHPTGKFTCPAVFKWFNLRIDIFDQVVILFNGGIKNGGKKVEVLFYRQILVQRKTPGHIPHPFTDLLIIFHHIKAIHRSCSFLCE